SPLVVMAACTMPTSAAPQGGEKYLESEPSTAPANASKEESSPSQGNSYTPSPLSRRSAAITQRPQGYGCRAPRGSRRHERQRGRTNVPQQQRHCREYQERDGTEHRPARVVRGVPAAIVTLHESQAGRQDRGKREKQAADGWAVSLRDETRAGGHGASETEAHDVLPGLRLAEPHGIDLRFH